METVIEDLIYVFIFLVKTHDTRKNGLNYREKKTAHFEAPEHEHTHYWLRFVQLIL